MKLNKLDFEPMPGMASSHLQMIVPSFLPIGNTPPSIEWDVDLGEGDFLSCKVSTPVEWKSSDLTVVLVHGMGGSEYSNYMIRMARKLYLKGIKAVRVNLRGCGSGKGKSKRFYNAGNSHDILKVLQGLKEIAPHSEIDVIGFSLGGNIILKMAGELGLEAKKFVRKFIAVCAPLDLCCAVCSILEKRNSFYHYYYLKNVKEQSSCTEDIHNLLDFDDRITAPPWGYVGAAEYYHKCSSIRYLPHIEQTTHLLFAEDDPFISFDGIHRVTLQNTVKVWVTEKGGHLGFLGKSSDLNGFYWMDQLLLNWIEGDFESNKHASEK